MFILICNNAEGFGKELEAYNKSFTSMIRDPFDQLFVHPAWSTAVEVPQLMKEEAYTFKEAGETKKKVQLNMFILICNHKLD